MHLKLSTSYLRALSKFVKNSKVNAEKTKATLRLLKKNPRYPSLHLEKLAGIKIWTVRIDKGNRIFLYFIDKGTVLLIDIGKHDKYRRY